MPSEEELLFRLKQGEERAAEEFVWANSGWMLSVARRYMMDEALAEDCVQEAFMRAFDKIETFEGRSKLKSWLYRILVSTALMKIRSRQQRDEYPIDDLLPKFDEFGCRIKASWSMVATPAEIFESTEIHDLVKRKIEELPENLRIVLLLRDIEELSTVEAAALLNVTEGTLKARLHRARAALKSLLEPVLGVTRKP
ncbi:MAG: sigma-70 family RNA polymerase sigma factor [Hyphomicrobiaceae bacterium]|nr:sigma-70 family RNA polymerase sigma factor [Hyphomicrobiaceae bacterium]